MMYSNLIYLNYLITLSLPFSKKKSLFYKFNLENFRASKLN